MARTLNVSPTVFQALKTGLVSYIDLDSYLSLEDALNVIEIHQVAEQNKMVIEELQNAHS